MKNTLVIFITKKELYAMECVSGRKQYISMNGNQRMKLENEESVDAFCQYLLDEYSLNEFSELDQQVILVNGAAENSLANYLTVRVQKSNHWEKYNLERLLVLAVVQKKETAQQEYLVSFDKENYRVCADKVNTVNGEKKVQLTLTVEDICEAACQPVKENQWKGADNTKLLAEKDAAYAEMKEKLEATLAGVNNEKEVLKKRVKQLIEENLELQKKLDEMKRCEDEKQKEKQRREERARREKIVFEPCQFKIRREIPYRYRNQRNNKEGVIIDGIRNFFIGSGKKIYFKRKENCHGGTVTSAEIVGYLYEGNYWAPSENHHLPVSVNGRIFFVLPEDEELKIRAMTPVTFAYIGPPEATQEDFDYFMETTGKEQ